MELKWSPREFKWSSTGAQVGPNTWSRGLQRRFRESYNRYKMYNNIYIYIYIERERERGRAVLVPPYILAENHINPWVGTRFLVFHHHKNQELFTKFFGVHFLAFTWKILFSWGKRMVFEMHAKKTHVSLCFSRCTR